ncbi:MAG: hypothetical protein U1D96_05245 [Eubacteriales bacterium]|nr:hypothetical protein [Clostridia bacterium]MDZ4042885.1 hypothetical protein [Eubacteriales bacterium]
MRNGKETARRRRSIRRRIAHDGIIVSGKRYFSENWIRYIGETVIIKGGSIFLERNGCDLGQLKSLS